VSTWPWTKCPPMRVSAETARSRLTFEPFCSAPRLVRRSVSGAHPILKDDLSNSVTVRHVPVSRQPGRVAVEGEGPGIPLTLMLSPRCASPSMSSHPEMVNDVPPPPDAVLSSSSRAATASQNQPPASCLAASSRFLLPIVSTIPVNMMIGIVGAGAMVGWS
jgi:hypothetical protein